MSKSQTIGASDNGSELRTGRQGSRHQGRAQPLTTLQNRQSTSDSCRDTYISEQVFKSVPVIHLRPTLFLEWLLYPWQLPYLQQGVLRMPAGKGRHSPIAVDDQGRAIAALLKQPEGCIGTTIDFSGPVEMDHQQMAAKVHPMDTLNVEDWARPIFGVTLEGNRLNFIKLGMPNVPAESASDRLHHRTLAQIDPVARSVMFSEERLCMTTNDGTPLGTPPEMPPKLDLRGRNSQTRRTSRANRRHHGIAERLAPKNFRRDWG